MKKRLLILVTTLLLGIVTAGLFFVTKHSPNAWIAQNCPSKTEKSECITEKATRQAIDSGNIGYCEYIKASNYDNYFKKHDFELCKEKTAISHKNYSMCDELTQPYKRIGCYRDIAVAKLSVSECKTIPVNDTEVQLEFRNDCYKKIATQTKDVHICSYVTDFANSPQRDDCYSSVGIATKDTYVCKMATDVLARFRCLENITDVTKVVQSNIVWQTYNNNPYHFSFEYPSSVFVDEGSSVSSGFYHILIAHTNVTISIVPKSKTAHVAKSGEKYKYDTATNTWLGTYISSSNKTIFGQLGLPAVHFSFGDGGLRSENYYINTDHDYMVVFGFYSDSAMNKEERDFSNTVREKIKESFVLTDGVKGQDFLINQVDRSQI